MQLLKLIGRYASNDDPLVAVANTVALIVACDQPFYPLTLRWAVGPDIGISFFTLLTTPLFIAVPAVARRHSVAGRALLVLAGTANTMLCTKLFGEATGVELFLGPCLLLSGLLFRQSERIVSFALIGLLLAIILLLRGHYGAPVHPYTDAESKSFLGVNVFSVAMLTTYLGVSLGRAQAQAARKQD